MMRLYRNQQQCFLRLKLAFNDVNDVALLALTDAISPQNNQRISSLNFKGIFFFFQTNPSLGRDEKQQF